MPGHRIPKVVAALLATIAAASAPVDTDQQQIKGEAFVEVLSLESLMDIAGEGESVNGGCAEH